MICCFPEVGVVLLGGVLYIMIIRSSPTLLFCTPFHCRIQTLLGSVVMYDDMSGEVI